MAYKNPEDNAANQRKWRKRPDVVISERTRSVDRAAKMRAMKSEIIRKHKAKPCDDCGVSYPFYVMDFDHVRGVKEFNIATCKLYQIKRLALEIAKCDLVCANCHRERTYIRRNPS